MEQWEVPCKPQRVLTDMLVNGEVMIGTLTGFSFCSERSLKAPQ